VDSIKDIKKFIYQNNIDEKNIISKFYNENFFN